jgi:hypothetical protein
MEASGVGSEDASVLHPDNPTPININTQTTIQLNQNTFRHNKNINHRTQTKAIIPTDMDVAVEAGKQPLFFLFHVCGSLLNGFQQNTKLIQEPNL